MTTSTLYCLAASLVTQDDQPELQDTSVHAAELPILASQEAKVQCCPSTTLLQYSHNVSMKDDALEAKQTGSLI